jgi:transcriptional regulator with XRE-family HTH domain
MLALRLTSPAQILQGVAARMKRRRLDFNLTQRELAERSGVSYGSLRLFEETGKASFEAVVKIAFALEAESEFESLFPQRPVRTLEEIIGRPVKQRVRKK